MRPGPSRSGSCTWVSCPPFAEGLSAIGDRGEPIEGQAQTAQRFLLGYFRTPFSPLPSGGILATGSAPLPAAVIISRASAIRCSDRGPPLMTEGIALTSHARVNEDVVFRDLEGELVLLNLKTGVYFGIDPIGTRIWHLMQEHRSLREIRDALLEEYEVTKRQCEDDLLRFVGLLREKDLIEVRP